MDLKNMKEAFKAVLNKFSAEDKKDESKEVKFADLKAGDIDLRIDGIESLEDLKEGLTVGLIDAGDVITQLEDGVYKLNDGFEIKVENSEIVEFKVEESEDESKEDEKEEESKDEPKAESDDESKADEKEDEVKDEPKAEEVSEEVAEVEVDLVEEF